MATAPPPRASTAPDPAPSPAGVVFEGVPWSDYEAMLRIVGERPIRVIYDRGTMEVYMPSFGHEDDAHLLGRVVETLTDEANIPVKAGRTTTHKRADLDRGTEPDQCYWFGANARRMVGKRQLDLSIDPPPDLVIEVDVTSTALKRLPVFAALGVPEVWRLAGPTLEFLHLQPGGAYRARDPSRQFPNITAAEVARLLEQGRGDDETTWVRSLRVALRALLAIRAPDDPAG